MRIIAIQPGLAVENPRAFDAVSVQTFKWLRAMVFHVAMAYGYKVPRSTSRVVVPFISTVVPGNN